ncbi:hypothetical protein ACP70R_015622 [Stipagrostis hirtigluma subsp. patula]
MDAPARPCSFAGFPFDLFNWLDAAPGVSLQMSPPFVRPQACPVCVAQCPVHQITENIDLRCIWLTDAYFG